MWDRIRSLIVKELIQLWRDKLILIVIILGPVSELALVAWATSADIEHIPTAIVDRDRTTASRELVQALVNTRTFDANFYLDSEAQARDLVDAGTALAAVLIPVGFGEKLAAPASEPAQVQIILDGADPSAARVARMSAEGVVGSYAQQASLARWGSAVQDWGFVVSGLRAEPHPERDELRDEGPQSKPQPNGQVIDLDTRVWFNEELKMSNYEVPSELGFMLIAVALMLASLGIARERELGTMEQLLVTPLRSVELVIGKAVPAMILSYLNFLLMLAMTVFLFGVPIRGSLPLLLAIAFFYLFVEIGWGLMVSAISKTQWQALLTVFLLMMAEMIFSGYAFPVENMPRPLALASNFVPIKHWLIILRSILLKGAGIEVFWRELLALAGLGLVINVLTLLFLRKQLE
ncbi:MAG: ABC transporter permease [Anaerolineae bacterium]